MLQKKLSDKLQYEYSDRRDESLATWQVSFTGAASYLEYDYAVAQYCGFNCGNYYGEGIAKINKNKLIK